MKTAIKAFVSKKVKELRIQKGWSQERLAQETHFSSFYIANKENLNTDNFFTLEDINVLAKAFQCSLWELLPEFPLEN